MNSFHVNQLNKVLNYIDASLSDDLNLEKLASVGNYSAFHFHRLFSAYTGETLNSYIVRKRVEAVAAGLIRNRNEKITALAYAFGFSSNAALTKAFQKHYGLSPAKMRSLSFSRYDKLIKRKNGQYFEKFEQYICHIDHLTNWIKMNATISLKEIEAIKMVYVNHIGINGLDAAFEKVITWTIANKWADAANLNVIRVYHDSFKITSQDKVRMKIGVPVKVKVDTDAEIHYQEIPVNRCIMGSFEIDLMDFEKSWSAMFIWMNNNGYKPSALKPFEIIKNDFRQHPAQKCMVDLVIPVE